MYCFLFFVTVCYILCNYVGTVNLIQQYMGTCYYLILATGSSSPVLQGAPPKGWWSYDIDRWRWQRVPDYILGPEDRPQWWMEGICSCSWFGWWGCIGFSVDSPYSIQGKLWRHIPFPTFIKTFLLWFYFWSYVLVLSFQVYILRVGRPEDGNKL